MELKISKNAESRKISQKQGTKFYIHGKDRKIQNKDSHGNASYPLREWDPGR